MSDKYAKAGVDTKSADGGVSSLIQVLKGIELSRPSRSVLRQGHYAAVMEVAPNLGIALGTDGVGSKLIIAEQLQRYDTVGIDCIAMNVNDVICVGAKPIALVDYIAVEESNPDVLRAIALGLKVGAQRADIEIPGGELAVVPELIQGHPSPGGFDLVGTCIGTVALDRIITGEHCQPGDVIIGLPSSGLHSNGYTLARHALQVEGGLQLTDEPEALAGLMVGEVLLTPTTIYVRGILELLSSAVSVRGLAHITGGGVVNLLRLNKDVGFEISDPLPVPPIFELIESLGSVSDAEMWEVFNMGCGFCVIVPQESAAATVELLSHHHPNTAVIGRVTADAGRVSLTQSGLTFN